MRVGQVWQWVYHWGVRDFALMTNLAKDYRALLAENFTIEMPEVVTRQVSEDGTRKYLVRIAGGHEVEVVYIPETDRGTLCISSQVGCTLTCSFCHTGTQKLVRNLTAAEIVGQVMLARDDLDEWPVPGAPKEEVRLVSNIVLMGMGEPLVQFRQRPRRDAGRDGWRRHRPWPPPDHAVDQRRGAGDCPHRDGNRLPAGGQLPRDDRCGA
jgi:23S rRNA (adenine2503-C2)-methyltransferase